MVPLLGIVTPFPNKVPLPFQLLGPAMCFGRVAVMGKLAYPPDAGEGISRL